MLFVKYNFSVLSRIQRHESTKATGDIILSLFILGIGENLRRFIILNQVAQQEEGRFITDARCLLHIMGDDDDGVVFLQL